MQSITAFFMAALTALLSAFGFSDVFSFDPAKIEFESANLVSGAQISVSTNQAFKWTLTDKSSLTYWMTGKQGGEYIQVDFPEETAVNTVVLRENTDSVKLFKVLVLKDGEWECVYEQDRILTYRMCTFDEVKTSSLRIEFTEINDSVSIGGLEIYNEDRTGKTLRVSDYYTINANSDSFLNAEGFGDYFECVTDLIVFESARLNENGEIEFKVGEAKFKESMEKINAAVEGKNVTLWSTVLFQLESDDPNVSNDDYRMNFIENNLDKIAESIKSYVEEYNFDGVDFDWEFPQTKKHYAAYDKLIKKISEFTKVSIASTTWTFGFSQESIELIDHFNVMTYDLFDDRGDHSNIYIGGRNAVEKYIGFGVPKEKIFLGIPTYGRPDNGDEYWPSFSSMPQLGMFGNYVPDVSYTDIHGQSNTCGVYFNSAAEARDKAALAAQYGLGGVMVFNMNSDAPYSAYNSIHRAIYSATH